MSRPPSRLPSVLASLGKTNSVISDRESATLRGGSTGSTDSIGFSVDNCVRECKSRAEMRARLTVKEVMDKIAMLTQILEQNPSDAFARYGLAMEHANQ